MQPIDRSRRRLTAGARALALGGATALATAAGAPVAAAAAFTLEDGARIDGAVAAFGARYIVVAQGDGGYAVLDRAALASVRVSGEDGPVEGRLTDWSDGGFLIETPSGAVRVFDAQTTGALAGQQLGAAQLVQADGIAADADVAGEPPLEGASGEATEPDETALSNDGGAALNSALEDAVASAADALVGPPEVDRENAEPEAPDAAGATALDPPQPEPAVDADGPLDAPPRAASLQSPAAPGPSAAELPETGAVAPPDRGGLIIPSDSPSADRDPDNFQILTEPPTPATTLDETAEPPERATETARSPNSPRAPALTAPSMATPQLSFPEQNDATGVATATAAAEAQSADQTADAGARSPTSDELGPDRGVEIAASLARSPEETPPPDAPEDAELDAERAGEAGPTVSAPDPTAAPPEQDAPPDASTASEQPLGADIAAEPAPELGAPASDDAPADYPTASAEGQSGAVDAAAADPLAAPSADPAPTASSQVETPTDGESSATPEAPAEPLIVESPPSSEASPLEDRGDERVVEAQADGEETPEAFASFDPTFVAEDAAAATAPAAADAPPIPGVEIAGLSLEPSTGGLFEEHKMGVFGPPPGLEGRISCARLGAAVASPRPYSEGRVDPGALAIAIGPDAPERAAQAFAASFLSVASDEPISARDEAIVFTLAPAEPQLAMPDRVVGVRVPESLAPFETGAADIAIVGGAPPNGAYEAGRARLIGFDALALVAHPDAPQDALSASDLSGLFLGRVSDWSMIDPQRSGPALAILPPDGAPALIATLEFAGARRARPSSSRRIDGAATRAETVAVTPGSIGLTLWSIPDAPPPLRLGGRSSGVAPSLDTIRSGAYPLPWPIYAVLPEEPTHASAAILFEYLSGPEGQRAVFEAGLAPVAACDPTTCGLSALGLASARERLSTPRRLEPLTLGAPESAVGQMVASFTAPVDLGAPPDAFVEALAAFIASIEPGGALLETPLRIVARSGPAPGSTEAADSARAASGRARAESAALALRCAGLRVEEVVLDRTPLADDDVGGLRIELLTRE